MKADSLATRNSRKIPFGRNRVRPVDVVRDAESAQEPVIEVDDVNRIHRRRVGVTRDEAVPRRVRMRNQSAGRHNDRAGMILPPAGRIRQDRVLVVAPAQPQQLGRFHVGGKIEKILVIDPVEIRKRLGVGVRGSHRSNRVDGPIGVRLANRPNHRRRHNSVPKTGQQANENPHRGLLYGWPPEAACKRANSGLPRSFIETIGGPSSGHVMARVGSSHRAANSADGS